MDEVGLCGSGAEPVGCLCRLTNMLKRALLVVAVVGAVLSVGAAPAQACSCGIGPVEDLLEEADGAFIGSLVEVGAADDSGDDVAYTFDVTEWIKGQRDPGAFDVFSARGGAACGFESPVGHEVAVFVWVRGDHATGGLCSTLDAATVRATVRPPQVSDRAGQYLATGWPTPSYVLDADGGTVAAHPAGSDQLAGTLQTTCGGSMIAERRGKEVALIDISTFDDVEVLQFNRSARKLLCDTDRVFAVAGPKGERQVYDVRTREPVTGQLVSAAHVALVDGNLIYRGEANESNPEGWRTLNLSSGTERFIAEMSRSGRRMESVDFSPESGRIALTLAEGNQPVLDLVVVSVPSGEIITRTIETHVASVRWLDESRVFVSTEGGGYPDTVNSFIASGDDLNTIVEFDSELYWPTYIDGDRLVGLDGGRFRSMPVTGGPSEVLNEIPGDRHLLRLPDPVNMTTVGSAAQEPIDTPIPSPRIEAIVARTAGVPGSTGTPTPIADPDPAGPDEATQIIDAPEPELPVEPDATESATALRDSTDDTTSSAAAAVFAAAAIAALATASVFVRRRRA